MISSKKLSKKLIVMSRHGKTFIFIEKGRNNIFKNLENPYIKCLAEEMF